MTAIAYRNGVLAADTASWHAGVNHARVQKIIRLKDGSLFAGAGPAEHVEAYLRWRQEGGDRPELPEGDDGMQGILVNPNGTVQFVEGLCLPYDAGQGPFYALGAHVEFLYGAMAAGASAFDAVKLCIELCDSAGGVIQVERLEPAP